MTDEERVYNIINDTINPLLAIHSGKVSVSRVEGNIVYIVLQGGCQGCAKAKQTLKQFVEQVIIANVPHITSVVDITNHADGENPYYKVEECEDEVKD